MGTKKTFLLKARSSSNRINGEHSNVRTLKIGNNDRVSQVGGYCNVAGDDSRISYFDLASIIFLKNVVSSTFLCVQKQYSFQN